MKKERKPINSIALLMLMLAIICIATHLIPAGMYDRIEVAGCMVVDPDSFVFIENHGARILDYFLAIPNGFANATALCFGFMVGSGTLEVIQKTGALNVGISRMIKKVGTKRGDLILVIMFYMFAVLGGFVGFVEGCIPFWPLAISISLALGYDAIVGVAISMIGACSGYLCGPTNPSSVAISQTIGGLELYSGIWLRLVLFAVLPLTCLIYIMWYAKRVRKNPEKSYMAGVDTSELAFDTDQFGTQAFTKTHMAILTVYILGLLLFVYGAVQFGWGFHHMSAIFIAISVLTTIIGRIPVDDAIAAFAKGCAGMINACLLLGIAYGIAWVLAQANVLDTIVYYFSLPLQGKPPVISLIGILIAIMLINLLIPSGSAKAAIVMPIIFPIAQIIDLTPQTAVLAYQFGDGITNMCGPLYGTLLLVCSMGKVPFSKWEKFFIPLLLILTILAFAFLFFAQSIGYC